MTERTCDQFAGNKRSNKYMATVKVGSKGQIVIPKRVRDLFKISSGDILLLRADLDGGIAIQPVYMVADLFNGLFHI